MTTLLRTQGVDQVARNVARILTLAERCISMSSMYSGVTTSHVITSAGCQVSSFVLRRPDIPFYVGAGEPLLPLDEPMDAVFVRLHPLPQPVSAA